MRALHLSPLLIMASIAAWPAAAQTDLLALAESAVREARMAADAAERAARNAEAALEALKAARGAITAPAADTGEPGTRPAPPSENMIVVAPDATAIRKVDAATINRALASSVANGPNDSFLKTAEAPDLQFTVSEKEKVASISVSFNQSRTTNDRYLLTDQFTLSGSSKLDESGETSLGGLKGFANGTDVSLIYTNFRTPVVWSKASRPQVERARTNCLKQKQDVRARGLTAKEIDAAIEAEAKACNPYDYATGVGDFAARYNAEQYRELLNSVLPGQVDFYGFKVTGNQAAYTYLDRALFKQEKESQFGFSASVFGGALLKNGQTALTGSFTYKRDYEAADMVNLCQPVGATTLTQCISSADGKPTRKNQAIFALEGRYAFSTKAGSFTKLAIAPEVSADVNNEAYSVVFPFYFAGEETGKLRAGVRGVYTNQKDKEGGRDADFQIGVFIGSPFSLLPN
jgi:hypothetical protein